jgi:hypothetical protein
MTIKQVIEDSYIPYFQGLQAQEERKVRMKTKMLYHGQEISVMSLLVNREVIAYLHDCTWEQDPLHNENEFFVSVEALSRVLPEGQGPPTTMWEEDVLLVILHEAQDNEIEMVWLYCN